MKPQRPQATWRDWVLLGLLAWIAVHKVSADRWVYREWWREHRFRQATTLQSVYPPEPNHNALLLGAASPIDGAYAIPLNLPIELDGKTKAEVLRLRAEAVRRHPKLIQEPYVPSETVFGQIADGAPWWGLHGIWYYGAGEHSIDGPAEESRFLINPFLLVAADFNWFTIWNGPWRNKELVTEERLHDPDFPLECRPASLRWWPRQRKAEVTYELSHYLREANRFRLLPLSVTDVMFNVVAYNARDCNFNYLFVALDESEHVVQSQNNQATGAVAIPQFIHRGGSCGYPGGCNNMSPAAPALEQIAVTAVPARLHLKLWRDQPKAASDPADFVFVLNFE